MRNLLTILALCAALMATRPADAAEGNSDWTGSFNLTYGQRNLDQDFWNPVEEQPSAGGYFTFGKKDWPAHILLGFSTSVDEKLVVNTTTGSSYTATGETREFDLGGVVALDEGIARPFASVGIAMVTAVAKGTIPTQSLTTKEDDIGFGAFFMGGINFRVFEIFNAGAVVKLVTGTEVTLFDETGDVNSIDYSLFVGWTF